jgi:uncharacterized protein YdaU (DUF1376 family)
MRMIGHNSAAYGETVSEISPVLPDDHKKLFHYVQWHLADYITGTQGMTPEQEGIYMRFLVRLYDRGKAFTDDDRFMASVMSLDVRKWRRVKIDLIGHGKILVKHGCLTNSRFEKERQKRAEDLLKQADSTRRYWEKKRAEQATSERSRGEVGEKSGRSRRDLSSKSGEKVNEINETRKHPTSQTRDQRLETKERKKEDTQPAGHQSVAAGGLDHIEGLNGSSSLMRTRVAKWLNPYQPDYRTAQTWLTSTVALFGEGVVRDAFADMETKIASGDVVASPLKLFTAICQGKKNNSEKPAPAYQSRQKSSEDAWLDREIAQAKRDGLL